MVDPGGTFSFVQAARLLFLIYIQTCSSFDLHTFSHDNLSSTSAHKFPSSFLLFTLYLRSPRASINAKGGTAICSRAGVIANKLRTRT